jgi:hypothetical protein
LDRGYIVLGIMDDRDDSSQAGELWEGEEVDRRGGV